MSRAPLVVLGALVVAPLFGDARAQTTSGPITLSWSAPAGCPSEAAVLAGARAMLGAESGSERPVAARATVTRTVNGFKVHLTTTRDRARGERTLEADSCDALGRAAALILVLTVDPSRAAALPVIGAEPVAPPSSATAPGPTPPPAPTAPASSSAAPPPPPAPAAAPERAPPSAPASRSSPPPSRTPHRFAIFAAGALDSGSLPSLAPGATLGVAWTPRLLRVELEGSFWAPGSASLAAPPVDATFNLVSGGARVCGAFAVDAFEWGPCVGGDVAAMRVDASSGSTALTTATKGAMWGMVSGGGDVAWAVLPPFGLRLRVDGFVPTARPSFVVQRLNEERPSVHRVAPLGLRAALGLEARFL